MRSAKVGQITESLMASQKSAHWTFCLKSIACPYTQLVLLASLKSEACIQWKVAIAGDSEDAETYKFAAVSADVWPVANIMLWAVRVGVLQNNRTYDSLC